MVASCAESLAGSEAEESLTEPSRKEPVVGDKSFPDIFENYSRQTGGLFPLADPGSVYCGRFVPLMTNRANVLSNPPNTTTAGTTLRTSCVAVDKASLPSLLKLLASFSPSRASSRTKEQCLTPRLAPRQWSLAVHFRWLAAAKCN